MNSKKEINLESLGEKYNTRKRFHHYLSVYESYFRDIRENIRLVLELGVLRGASLGMWSEYFPNARIIGVDLKEPEQRWKRCRVLIGDVVDREFLNNIGKSKKFDIIIDDCGHWQHQQQIAFGTLFKYVKPGGYYILEDLSSGERYKPYYKLNLLPQQTNIKELDEMMDYHKFTMTIGKYGVMPELLNSTLKMLEKFKKTGKISSIYMTKQEKKYLEDNIKSLDIHYECRDENDDNKGIIAFIKKRG